MKLRYEHYILICICLISIAFKMFIFWPEHNFDDDSSYYAVRQIESIIETGIPLYHDQLSYSGRENSFVPGFYYMLAIFHYVAGSDVALKIFLAVVESISLVFIYLIVNHLTKNITVGLISSFIGVFNSSFLILTVNKISNLSLSITLMLVCFYLFMRIDEKRDWITLGYVIAIILLAASSSSVFIFVAALSMYMILMEIDDIEIKDSKKEAMIFAILSSIWIQFLFYKKALAFHGAAIIWQNIPSELLENYFVNLNILSVIYYIGPVPFIFGLLIIYRYFFRVKSEDISLFISFLFTVFFLLLLKLIRFSDGLAFFSICFIILFGVFYKNFLVYFEKTKFGKREVLIGFILLLLVFFTSVLPSYALLDDRQRVGEGKFDALSWIGSNTDNDSIVIGTINEGNLISGVANRKNVIDGNYLLIRDLEQRFSAVRTAYTSSLLTAPLEVFTQYNVEYILVDDAKQGYDISTLRYSNDKCMRKVYDKDDVEIYKIECTVSNI